MKGVNVISKGNNHKAIDIGDFENLSTYSFPHPKLGLDVKGKLFVGELIESTGTEISFQELSPKTTIPFLHQHNEHEEIYIIIKGYGQFQVDNESFDIKEGSIVKVSPKGKRTLRNDGENPMIYMVIQAKNNSLTSNYISDGYGVDGQIKLNA